MRALIVDEGRERSSVAAARALAARGWTVGAASPTRNICSRSKATSAWHPIVHTDQGDDAFLDSLDTVVRREGYEVVFLTWERAIAAVSAERERLSFPVGYGPHEGLLTAIDKGRLTELAGSCGLGVPRTASATREGIESLGLPVIVKPASQLECTVLAAACDSVVSALEHAAKIEGAGGHPIAQEKLEGGLIALSLVAGDTGVVSIAQQTAELMWPQPIGITARGLSVPIDPQLREGAERLLSRLEWRGLADMQFLVPPDRAPRLIDFNPRLYGSLALAIRAGANHPDAWGRVTLGMPVEPMEGRPGARYQWFSRDLRASLAAHDRASQLARCFAVGSTAAHSLWNWGEPWLAPRFMLEQTGRALRRRLAAR